jgi:hypothetical protein
MEQSHVARRGSSGMGHQREGKTGQRMDGRSSRMPSRSQSHQGRNNPGIQSVQDDEDCEDLEFKIEPLEDLPEQIFKDWFHELVRQPDFKRRRSQEFSIREKEKKIQWIISWFGDREREESISYWQEFEEYRRKPQEDWVAEELPNHSIEESQAEEVIEEGMSWQTTKILKWARKYWKENQRAEWRVSKTEFAEKVDGQ